ncbi:MAG: sigma-70 family RNA polymerase sigma factor [Clostridia bacterium]|nr:sigma-70 family RNA polymerase sigma factor [Clostridia bacterium]
MIDFEALISGVMQPLERFVKFRVGNLSDAEDILQEVLTAAYRGADTLSDEVMFKPWILGIARNKCNDYFRAKAKRMEIPLESLDETALTTGIHGVTTRAVVHETLNRLGDTDKQILYLSYFRDLRQAEIASRLGIPVGTVKSRLYHAKQQFRDLYPEKPKGEIVMKNERKFMPEYMPDYQIKEVGGEPFAVCWEEIMGWLIVPKLGEAISWAMYDFPKRRRTEQCDMKVVGKAMVHGIEGVEIEAIEYDPMDCNRIDGADVAKRRFVAQLTDTHCRYLAECHEEDGLKKLYTFLDGDDFLQSWGFGEDNCGNETHIAPKGLIRKDGNIVATVKQPFMLDVVGRFEVQINGKTYDTVCVIDAGAYEEGVVTEQYLDRSGRTVLWRRFNRNDWMQESYKRPWTELLPENERMTVDGETYVHWYDCISDHIL